ncbi:hypothetical protein DICVIV_11772 [Dictyocaulus viviparus]|uniref:Uncharacterized protein n=1 Tax=Dictyocaulus viviparus TaxID=29172 RepID=A0A0D8XCD4_DICVI|nr:hypothetical protein DICVIV_11772 [Dictyocaulus viviparus]
MTSARHVIRIEGGTPYLTIYSGQVCIEVKANHGLSHTDEFLPTFVMPVDQFTDIGPDKVTLATTIRPSIASASIPRELLASSHFNQSDHCAGCRFYITKNPTTKLPSKIIPTFPPLTNPTAVILPTLSTMTTHLTDSTTVKSDVSSVSLSSEQTSLVPDTTLSLSTVIQNIATISTDVFETFTPTATTPAEDLSIYPTIATAFTENSISDTAATTLVDIIDTSVSTNTSSESINTSVFTNTPLPSGSTAQITESIQSNRTSDQFVIGQYGDLASTPQTLQNEEAQQETAVISTPMPETVPSQLTSIEDWQQSDQHPENSETTLSLNVSSDDASSTSEFSYGSITSPNSTPLNVTSGIVPQDLPQSGAGGSWETETLFPTPVKIIPKTKPSVLVLKMRVPSELDLQSFDLTKNLTSSLSKVVRESLQRVKRGKRSLQELRHENLVKVHRIERVGNSMNVIFSVNETDVDSKIVENDLYSLDLNYLTRFVAFPVLSTISKTNTDDYHNFMVAGIIALLLSIVFFCIVFRSIIKERARSFSVSINRFFTTCRLPTKQRVTSITIVTDETLTP